MARRNHTPTAASKGARPVLALLSNDVELTQTVEGIAQSEWSMIKPELARIGALSREPDVRLVIFDDQLVTPADRGWALSEIRRSAARASIIYVAAEHSHENEKQARTRGVLFYTAKPLIAGDVILLLQRLLQMQNGKHNLAHRPAHGQG